MNGESSTSGEPDHPSPATSGGGLGRTALLNSARLAGALLASWVLSLLGRFLLPRVLGTERFGELAFVEGVAVLAMSLTAFGVEGFIRREVTVDLDRARGFARPLQRIQIVAGIAISAALALAFAATSGPEQALVAGIFGLGQVAIVIGRVNAAYLQAAHDVRAASNSTVVTKTVWFALLLACFGAGVELLALPLAILVSELIRAVWLGHARRTAFGPPEPAPLRSGMTVIAASLPYYLNALNVMFLGYSVRVIVGVMGDADSVGLLATAELAVSVPMLLTPVLGWVAVPLFASLRARDPALMWHRVAELVGSLAVPVTAGCVLLFAFAEPLMSIGFGDDFAGAAEAFGLLALSVPATYFTQIGGSALIADGSSWRNTKINLYTMLLVVALTIGGLAVLQPDDSVTIATIAAASLLIGEWVTVGLLVWSHPLHRPPRRVQWSMSVLVVGAVLLLVIGPAVGDPLSLGVVAATFVVAAINLPATLADVTMILAGRGSTTDDGQDDGQDGGRGDGHDDGQDDGRDDGHDPDSQDGSDDRPEASEALAVRPLPTPGETRGYQITILCTDAVRMGYFWATALDYRVERSMDDFWLRTDLPAYAGGTAPHRDNMCSIAPRDGKGPRIVFVGVPRAEQTGGLPIEVWGGRTEAEQRQKAATLVAAGGRRVALVDGPSRRGIVLADPDGNEFTIV